MFFMVKMRFQNCEKITFCAYPAGIRRRQSLDKRKNRRRNFDVRRRIDVDISTVFIRRRKHVEKSLKNQRRNIDFARWVECAI